LPRGQPPHNRCAGEPERQSGSPATIAGEPLIYGPPLTLTLRARSDYPHAPCGLSATFLTHQHLARVRAPLRPRAAVERPTTAVAVPPHPRDAGFPCRRFAHRRTSSAISASRAARSPRGWPAAVGSSRGATKNGCRAESLSLVGREGVEPPTPGLKASTTDCRPVPCCACEYRPVRLLTTHCVMLCRPLPSRSAPSVCKALAKMGPSARQKHSGLPSPTRKTSPLSTETLPRTGPSS